MQEAATGGAAGADVCTPLVMYCFSKATNVAALSDRRDSGRDDIGRCESVPFASPLEWFSTSKPTIRWGCLDIPTVSAELLRRSNGIAD